MFMVCDNALQRASHTACSSLLPLALLQMVANSRSSEAFVAACLLTVGASSLLTKQMGLSDTLGAFVAGVLLSETSFRTQVCAERCRAGSRFRHGRPSGTW
jgi:Kef-type K+ transport system membrane component KefB